MREKKLGKYNELGLQIKAVREFLKKTLDEMSKETGISRSYISDFERGLKLPTGKYLKFLHDQYRININYIYGSEGRIARRSDTDGNIDFGKFQEDIDELLHFLAHIPHALYAVLGFFAEYKLENQRIIAKYLTDSQAESRKNNES